MSSMIYVSETFTSFQGTGHLLGERQHFIRFAGCSVKCPIRQECDEQSALTRKGAHERTVESIVQEALEAVGPRGWMHITGGEPLDQPDGLQELVKLARRSGLYVHLQTSGVDRVPIQWDWLTVSPKARQPLQTFGQEMIVVDTGTVPLDWLAELKATTSYWCYYLVPLCGKDPKKTAELAEKAGWMLTLQAHKTWGVK